MNSEHPCAVVLGGTTGLGRAIAIGLAPSGMAVNAAGMTRREPTLDVTDETWNRILAVDGGFLASGANQ